MTDDPQVWHYGLVARWWAEFNTDGPEIEYFKGFIERYGEPALDAACGAGRLLLPFLRAGLDVDACDISDDMLSLCEQRTQAEGFRPHLYRQAMHQLELPRKYRTIIVCGGFGLGGSRSHDEQALKRFFAHLEPGGVLLIDSYLPYKDPDEWRFWLNEERRNLPEAWPSSGRRKAAANGEEIELRIRIAALDPLDQIITRQIQAMLWRDGQVIKQEEYTLLERLYFRNEVIAMLTQAGFRTIDVLGDYTQDTATPESGVLIYVATA